MMSENLNKINIGADKIGTVAVTKNYDIQKIQCGPLAFTEGAIYEEIVDDVTVRE